MSNARKDLKRKYRFLALLRDLYDRIDRLNRLRLGPTSVFPTTSFMP